MFYIIFIQATMCFTRTGANVFHNKMTHETLGTVEWTETFCDEGVKVVSTVMITMMF